MKERIHFKDSKTAEKIILQQISKKSGMKIQAGSSSELFSL
jgi:hypothetical protein